MASATSCSSRSSVAARSSPSVQAPRSRMSEIFSSYTASNSANSTPGFIIESLAIVVSVLLVSSVILNSFIEAAFVLYTDPGKRSSTTFFRLFQPQGLDPRRPAPGGVEQGAFVSRGYRLRQAKVAAQQGRDC